jgi:hypothetical protein
MQILDLLNPSDEDQRAVRDLPIGAPIMAEATSRFTRLHENQRDHANNG